MRLGQLEAAVMDRLWQWRRPTAVREVVASLQEERVIAYTTVMTVLDNLHRKGLVSREKRGRAYEYRAVCSREQHTATLMGRVLADSENRGATLLHFVEQMSPEEVDKLKELLDSTPATSRTEPDKGGER